MSLVSHLFSGLRLSAAVCQDAQGQVQGLPGALRALEKLQQGPQTTLGPEPGDAGLVPLDVLRPDGHERSPLRHSGPLVQLFAAARVGSRSRLGQVSQAPGQGGLWWQGVTFSGGFPKLFQIPLGR